MASGTGRHTGGPRVRRIAALAAAVLGAHLLGLQALPLGHGTAAAHEAPAGLLQVRVLPAPAPMPMLAIAQAGAGMAPSNLAPPAPAPQPLRPARPGPPATLAVNPQPLAPAVEDPPMAAVPPQAPPAQALLPALPPLAQAAAPAWTVAAASVPGEAAGRTREAAAPVRLPPPMHLHYTLTGQARGFGLNGKAQIDWRHDGQHYELNLEFGGFPFPTRYQRSAGRITPQGLAPERFSDKLRSEEAAHFDAASGHIRFSGNQPDAPLMPGAQDRLSVLFQVGGLIAGRPQAWSPGRVITVQTATARDAEVWQFQVEGEEELRLPGGTQRSIRVVRLPRKEFDQKIELWLAPGMDYVPVRLRLTQPGGDWLDQQWSGTDKG